MADPKKVNRCGIDYSDEMGAIRSIKSAGHRHTFGRDFQKWTEVNGNVSEFPVNPAEQIYGPVRV